MKKTLPKVMTIAFTGFATILFATDSRAEIPSRTMTVAPMAKPDSNGIRQQITRNTPQLVRDLMTVQGNWKGKLTYLDYSTGNPYTMSADIDIKRIPGTNRFIFDHTYPKEKSANKADTITISQDGKYFGNAKLVSRKTLANGDLQLATERQGTDGNDNRAATIRMTYTLGKNQYIVRKDVMFSDGDKWIKRHEYIYEK